jgi:hypothetical protein
MVDNIFIKVVLPAPLGPTKPKSSPFLIVKSILLQATIEIFFLLKK